MKETLNYYSENAVQLSKRYETAEVSTLHDKLLKCFNGEKSIIELGCGSGRDAAFMVSKGFDITGVDGSNEMIKSALKLHPELSGNLINSDFVEYLDKIKKPFDGVYSIATLMHFDRSGINLLMQKINNALKRDGLFFFSVTASRDDIDDSGFDSKGRFFSTLDRSEWTTLCETNGFTEQSVTISNDGLGRAGITWLTCIFKKL